MTLETSTAASRDRAPELDLLRFLAATMVVFYHYAYRPTEGGVVQPQMYGALQDLATYGYLGVPLFFLISGFVIVWSAAGRTAGAFLKSRFLRLYPMFWVGVALTFAVVWLAGVRPELYSLRVVLANLTLVPAYFDVPFVDGVYWTLAIELKFYLLILAAILLRQMPRIEYWMYLWLAACGVLTFWNVPLLGSLAMLPHGFYFVGGALCYFIRTDGFNAIRGTALALAAAGSVYHAVQGRGDFTFASQMADPVVVGLLIVAFYAAMLVVALRWIQLPNLRLWLTLGALTYPLYLLHNMIGKVLFWELEFHVGPWTRLLIVSVIMYTLSWVCARWLEPATREGIAALLKRLGSPRLVPGVSRRAGE